jgi:hypothetical protein
MTATTLETTNALRFPATVRVSSRAVWSGDWTEHEEIYCDSLTLQANPAISAAACSMRFGRICQPGETVFTNVEAVDLQNKFVKIEIFESLSGDVDRTWVGVCRGQVDRDDGVRKFVLPGDDEHLGTGLRQYTVLGIESMLDQQIVLESGCEKPAGSGWWRIHRGLTFNEPHQRGKADGELTTGNRSVNQTEVRTDREVYLFPSSLDLAERWSSLDIAEYLLALFSPQSEDGSARVDFVLDYSFELALAWYETPIIAAEGRSVWSLLNQIFDRRRGVAFRVIFDTDTDQIKLVLFTFNPSNITGPDDTLPANTDQGDFDTDDACDIEGLTITSDSIGRVNQVVVRGARALTVCTLAAADGTLIPYWPSTLETEYETAGEDEPDFGTMDEDEQQLARENAMAQERYAKVFRDFGVPTDWDGKVKDGEAGTAVPHFPDIYGDGTASTLNYWIAGLRVESQLPLRTDSDYADDAIAVGVVNVTKSNTPWEWRPILAVAKTSVQLWPPEIQSDISTSDFDYDGRWLNLVSWDKNPVLEYAPQLYAVTPRPLQAAPGLALKVQGAPQYVFSDGSAPFDKLLEDYGLARIDTAYMAITVSIAVDGWCEGKYPASVSGSAIVERAIINAGDRARLIYVCPGTVIDFKDGELERSEGGYLRDDRGRLEALAQFAYRWYNTPRNKIAFTIHRCVLQPEVQIGRMITRIGGGGPSPGGPFQWTTVNTPITSIVYEFPEGQGPRPPMQRTRIATDFAALDFDSFYRE